MKMAQVKLIIAGRVQGVFYRHSTKEKARELGLGGWVKNLPDGSVEVQAKGAKDVVEKLIVWCRSGPPNARVENVSVEWLSDGGGVGTAGGGDTCAPFGGRQGRLESDLDSARQVPFQIL